MHVNMIEYRLTKLDTVTYTVYNQGKLNCSAPWQAKDGLSVCLYVCMYKVYTYRAFTHVPASEFSAIDMPDIHTKNEIKQM